jgi:DNA-binding NtrC family response regulator
MGRTRILMVDDDPGMLNLCAETLRGLEDTDVVVEIDSCRAAERLASETFDLLISDIRMPALDGIELLRVARQNDPNLTAVIMTGVPALETAVESMKLGAMDYLIKPFPPESLLARVRTLLEDKRLREENQWLRRQVERTYCCGDLLGKSAVMQKVCERIQRTAETDFDVLIIGETGTGKELVAHAIHEHSKRKEGPFAPVNCGAIPDELLESEFFGHERGAFTGAQTRSIGLLEYAKGGTFFLDELNQLPLRLQGKLLRVVQERKIRRVGGTKEIDIDVRIIAASSMSLDEAVERGQFRPDLYHRLNVARIEMPPLRERAEDIPMLINIFLERFGRELERKPVSVSPEALEVLVNYSWPGNVRELQNVIRRALAWARQEVLGLEDLPDAGGFFHIRERRLVVFEQEYFQALMRSCHGDVTAAAVEAKLPRGTLYRLLKKHDINPANFRSG